MKKGPLRERITIMRLNQVDNGNGGYADAWTPVATVRAEVAGLTGREVVMERALQGVTAYRIRTRWRADLKQSDQLRYRDRDLNIRSLSDPDGRRDEMLIIADDESVQAT